METLDLTAGAVDLLRRRLAGEPVEITDENRPLYRELAGAGLMIPLSTWAGGAESRFLFTEVGWGLREARATAPPP